MSEHVRNVRVLIEVDTNKQTYTLDVSDAESLMAAEGLVHEFFDELSLH